jgi:membrane protein YqaA with SNARE-associated domain
MTNYLLDIFTETACRSFALPACKSVTIETMWMFGGVDMTIPLVVAIVATLVGMMASYVLGQGLHRVLVRHKEVISAEHFALAQPYVLRFFSPLILIYWAGPLTVVSMFLGLFQMRWWKVALLTLCGALLRAAWVYHAMHAL